MMQFIQTLRRGLCMSALALASPLAALAQSNELPAYAYDMVAEISMATTAASTCEGAELNDRRLQKTMIDLMGRLSADGLDPVAAVQYLETDAAKEQIALREAALRLRHGAAPEGANALCAAIRAETKTNRALAKMVKMR